jgi:prophage DNA circulation protein
MTIENKKLLIRAISTLEASWGGDTPPEAYWAFTELANFLNKEFDIYKTNNDALLELDKKHYDSLLSIFANYATKKKALEDNLSAEEIAKLDETNTAKQQAVTELVNQLISIYSNLVQTRIDDLQQEIDATNQKIDEKIICLAMEPDF